MRRKKDTLKELYATLTTHHRYTHVSWIANVLYVSGGSSRAVLLRGLKLLVDAGADVSPAAFTMPTEALVVNGESVIAGRCLRAAVEGRVDLVQYVP